MCGIVGYIGDKQATPILLEGLTRLEYRGYDSAGIAILHNGNINIKKAKGRLNVLRELVEKDYMEGTIGIGHTRWATHGEPSDTNSHPHLSQSGLIAVVHNGIIENYLPLKKWLIEEGYNFISETDTEVVANLLEYYYNGDIVEALRKVLDRIEGSYALGVLCKDNPDMIVAARKEAPLIVGIGNGENFIASDIPAILKYTRNVYFLDDHEIAIIKKDSVEFIDVFGRKIGKSLFEVKWDVEAAEKGGYEHFMIKEIHEQPAAIKDTLRGRIINDSQIVLDNINITKEDLEKIEKIFIVACGTAYHAGVVGKYVIESFARIPVEVDVASEFRYRNPIVNERILTIVISQSGETADTIAALKEAKRKGSRVIAITNVVGSSVSREADEVLYTWAGPEIAVASTKAYTTQLIALYLIALDFALKKGTMSSTKVVEIISELKKLPDKVQYLLDNKEVIQKFASEHYNVKDVFYIGRGLDYAVAMEGSLKLKEISYIHSEAYPAGELKHGTLALVEEGTLIIALATQDDLFEKMLSNIKEVKARGGYVVAFAKQGNLQLEGVVDKVIYIPDTLKELTPVLTVVPLQLLAYYMAVEKGCDVDKPRNLAKSVTVE
ncbi:glucosamine--fructose-6-phosphate aminotransferase (isomerizing) [Caldanaerobacter subterraneus subsp. tengcongensis MB4]|uniref:Glutamine--fructose-6-phosphate aminotransferase [isomerizing] n=1 Tax=Caldanaerobacter subterraneus subsp. tengcongensis (strain DSM 15242 / JCM 11007 / NBRC 100824 / MB4) TaxID=273068 RepID=GLMS_CALS4|nr:glutamine--fructose-6-phosphate transaminase (isomerizing) [Caldanaerobacter subterraneus]Q8R841.3 RecName: Full=Glutamine--fructose-6-phosphate aminotransferase [isomerizing]; AltName: Full=D-fructose-6-phosphate amidotransferase; AltName: Full=GFAT; AltName: Full=Glucosamine-6-phosphate synthase; AltName: Full=Hexosephosphate aminotransferase; AltName: Full=L-glutamine--D-fructose-6-phosphate amidotransferase [Caldanaerobacter subterraneus subsp. tengcongensis MB4]AAM25347.1 Glucosamine 6-ph